MHTLNINNVSVKTKDSTSILANINFCANEKDIVAIKGSNGSGKTTLLKTCSGLIKPSMGSVIYKNQKPIALKNKFLKELGFFAANISSLAWDQKANDSLLRLRFFYGLSKKETMSTIEQITESLHCKELLKRKLSEMSFGERNIINLASTFIHSPRLLILDEPNAGLDDYKIKYFIEFFKAYIERENAIALIAFHHSEELMSICNKTIDLGIKQIKE